jgi:hypothetical protein
MRDRWLKKFRENRGGNEDRIIEVIDLNRAYNKLSLATVGSVAMSKETLVMFDDYSDDDDSNEFDRLTRDLDAIADFHDPDYLDAAVGASDYLEESFRDYLTDQDLLWV